MLTIAIGLRGCSPAYQFIIERDLLECDRIFAMCNIRQAVTDQTLDYVFDLARKAQLSNVDVICTHADVRIIVHEIVLVTNFKQDLEAEEAMNSWGPKGQDIIKGMLQEIAADERARKEIEDELDGYNDDDDVSDDEVAYKSSLYLKWDKIRYVLQPSYSQTT